MKVGPVARLLLRFIRGPGSEYLLGDLEEWRREESERREAGAPRRSYDWEVLKSVWAWWRPGSGRGSRGPSREGWWAGWWADVVVAGRALRRRPGYAVIVTAVLATGIAATTTVFTIVDRVLLRPLPHGNASRMVVLGTTFPGREWRTDAPDLQHLAGFALGNFLDWEALATSFGRMGAIERRSMLLRDEGNGPELVGMSAVTPGFLDILEVQPAIGRRFHPDEYTMSAPDVAMLSYDAWMSRYGGDPAVVGRTEPTLTGGVQVVGVLPREFSLPEALGATDDFWVPVRLDSDRYEDRGRRSMVGLATLGPTTSLDRARQELAALAARTAEEHPEGNVYPDGSRFGAGANLLQRETVGGMGRPLMLFSSASLLLLLIAGLNASNLALTRGIGRQTEIAVRLAMGASRRRIVRLLMAESLLISAAAGAMGIGLGYLGLRTFRVLGPPSIPRMAEIGLDARLVAAALALTFACGALTALLPALRLADLQIARRVRESTPSWDGGRTWAWSVGGQVALSLILTVAAGLLMESFVKVRTFDPGFDAASALTFQQGLTRPGTEDIPTHALWDEVLDVVNRTPGYAQVAVGSNLPYQSPNWAPSVLLEGESPDVRREGIAGYVITPNYFRVLGIPLLEGRSFDATDRAETQPVAIVNAAFVDMHMNGDSPLGTTIRFREGDSFQTMRVTGVVGNAVQTRAEEGVRPAVYVPYTQSDWPMLWAFARTTVDPLSGVAAIRKSMGEVNPYIPPSRIQTMEQRVRATQTNPRFNAAVAGAFGFVSLLLAAGGLYGALSFGVGRRLREIGIRMTLGADPHSVVGMILRQGMTVTLSGILVGLVVSIVTTRLLSGFLFGVSPLSPRVLALACATLVAVAAVASLGPARRAVRVDPASSLEVR